MSIEHQVVTADGRTLRVEEAGDPAGAPVLAHHGTPGAGGSFEPHVEDARARGIRLISYDRPGYGGSSPQPGRSVADCAADVRAIARALDIPRLTTWGVSGGGPHVLACAALLPEFVVAAASLASPAPYGAPGLDYFSSMGEENVEDTKLMLEDPVAARVKAKADRERLMSLTVEQMATAFPSLLSPVDAAAQTPELMAHLADRNKFALGPGDDGWWDDSISSMEPWGFDLGSISIPVQLWHGRHDRFVPFQHGEWLAGQIPGVDAHLTDVDGHVTLLLNRVPEVHAWLLAQFQAE